MQNHSTLCSFLIAFLYSVKVMRFLVYICNQQSQLTMMRSRTFLYYKQVKCIKIFISFQCVYLCIAQQHFSIILACCIPSGNCTEDPAICFQFSVPCIKKQMHQNLTISPLFHMHKTSKFVIAAKLIRLVSYRVYSKQGLLLTLNISGSFLNS